ncbi:MAG: hypothetical protein RLZZ296_2261, partial [Pseudomonadota bacterium]
MLGVRIFVGQRVQTVHAMPSKMPAVAELSQGLVLLNERFSRLDVGV